jgi:ABC-2 type transport system permease protein
MRPELIVAGKEFRDHLTSKRFLAIFAILMLLAVIGMATGMDQYNKTLEEYKKNQAEYQQQQWFKDQVAALQKQIADAQANGLSAEEITSLQQQLEMLINPPMPSALTVFGSLNQGSGFGQGYLTLILMLLSIALGFDLITREREEGSLKSLLSHPVYRDSVINGKFLGAMGILFVVMGSVFLVTLAIMLFYGVVPAGDDLLRVAAFFLMALLYCAVFFAAATLFSTVAKTSAMSILCVLSLVVALIIIPSFAPSIAGAIMGSPPEYTPIYYNEGDAALIRSNDTSDPGVGVAEPLPIKVMPGEDYQQYYQKLQMITDAISTISPMYGFGQKISPAIVYKQSGSVVPIAYSSVMKYDYYYRYSDPTLLDSLASVWTSILALLVELAVCLAASYILFLRSDVR